METTLTQATHIHHDRLAGHLDRMPAVGDMIGTVPLPELRESIDGLDTFFEELLLPHMEAAEATLYPELERMLQNRHSMLPMRREHQEIRELVAALGKVRRGLDDGHLNTGEAVALRRIIFRLFALMKVHLAEEELYLHALEQGGSEEKAERLVQAMEHAGIASF
jgi:hemerythrin-like domain-containing protein